MLYDRNDISERIDVAKRNTIKENIVCHDWYFDHVIKFRSFVCNDLHNLEMLCLNLSDIPTITVKGADYCCFIHDISKS